MSPRRGQLKSWVESVRSWEGDGGSQRVEVSGGGGGSRHSLEYTSVTLHKFLGDNLTKGTRTESQVQTELSDGKFKPTFHLNTTEFLSFYLSETTMDV